MAGDRRCPFCTVEADRVFHEGVLVRGLWDAFPISPGHALLVPRRHINTWFEATAEEQAEMGAAIAIARDEIQERFGADGFNVGMNVGPAAGQTVPHLHLHVIPRYRGDVPDPRGGIRHVIPGKGNYLQSVPAENIALTSSPREAPARVLFEPDKAMPMQVEEGGAVASSDSMPFTSRSQPSLDADSETRLLLRGGDEDPLLPELTARLAEAVRADFAVSFVLESGVRRLLAHLRDLVVRRGSFRLVTGDYLEVTEPSALQWLLDLQQEVGSAAVDVRVFEASGISFHPKAYLFYERNGNGSAYVGSSNLSEQALARGIEWNYRVVSSRDGTGFAAVVSAFEALLQHPATRPLNQGWIDTYRARWEAAQTRPQLRESPPMSVEPHAIQLEALAALEATRADGNQAGLVVLATGLGKTWLSAFDSNRAEFRRVLFVAHRDEILTQALHTFRQIRPDAMLGLYTGTEKVPHADVIFASIQTLGRVDHLERFASDAFDYVVVDEFHHAAAPSYRRLLEHFTPRFLLGLTATPERTDGGDLLALCGENLVYRCDLVEGIKRGLLSPFHYFGVPDYVDYRNIPWRSARFDEEALTLAVATRARAQNALEQYRLRAGSRTLAFCCSQRHADFMADYFREAGLRAVAVHTGPKSAPRARSLEGLRAGELDVVFVVDMFNEGVDLPEVNTVFMLRPTESAIVWLQQFGRGLRLASGKDHLRVIDYIGNHRSFLVGPRTLLGLGVSDHDVSVALDALRAGTFTLPLGCEVTYELEAIDILKGLLRRTGAQEALHLYYEDFRDRIGERPLAVEVLHDGYRPQDARARYRSWLRFVAVMGDLSEEQRAVLESAGSFLDELEKTQMTKSYKMLVLQAMLNHDQIPGTMAVDALAVAFAELIGRSARLRAEVGIALTDLPALRALLVENPIKAWTGRGYFVYTDGAFRTLLDVPPDLVPSFQELVREIVDWRLAEYLDRKNADTASPQGMRFVCSVRHQSGRPILSLPARTDHPEIPIGWTPVLADGEEYEANFAQDRVDTLRRPGTEENELPRLLHSWFGPDAGLPGTRFSAIFELADEDLVLKQPVGHSNALELWRRYTRAEIPPLLGAAFSPATWGRQGFIYLPSSSLIVLLVTLDKGDQEARWQYQDRFLSPDLFQWQSQNQATQEGKPGQAILHHLERGITVYLFVRHRSSLAGKTLPFTCCGTVEFVRWEGSAPITVEWRLREPAPERLWKQFNVPQE